VQHQFTGHCRRRAPSTPGENATPHVRNHPWSRPIVDLTAGVPPTMPTLHREGHRELTATASNGSLCSYAPSRCTTTRDSDRGSALHPSGCLRSVPSVFLPSSGGAAPPRFRRSLWLDASPSTFLRAPAPICPLCGQGRQQAAPHNPSVRLLRRRAAPHGPPMVRLQSTGPTSSVEARHRCVYRRYPARRCHTSRSQPRCDVLLWNRAVP